MARWHEKVELSPSPFETTLENLTLTNLVCTRFFVHWSPTMVCSLLKIYSSITGFVFLSPILIRSSPILIRSSKLFDFFEKTFCRKENIVTLPNQKSKKVYSVDKQLFSYQILFANIYLHANIFETKNGGHFLFGEIPNDIFFVQRDTSKNQDYKYASKNL